MTKTNQIELDDFVRRFSLRAKNLMWLLGAGASASAGIPTASDLTWEFKQQLYISQRRVSPQVVSDLSNPAVRGMLQSYIGESEHLPAEGSPDEYAALFEVAFPAESDRRAYLDAKLRGGKPSYGHYALATMMHGQLARLVWTTNFDSLIADACAKVYGTTGQLASIDLDTPNIAEQLINEERWPIEVKLHGDFRSRRLKNTEDELRHQDARLRQVLIDTCRRFGLIVVGYSGRDDSIMNTLREAMKDRGAFPAGLFWLHREGTIPLPRVSELLAEAESAGIDASLVSIENFDETMRDLIRIQKSIDTKALDEFAIGRQRWSAAPNPIRGHSWPVIRLNALPVTMIPSVCRCVVCNAGNYKETRRIIEEAGVNALTARTRAGVLAFGADAGLRTAFENYTITSFDLHTIDSKRLRYDSGERGLLREALTCALVRERGLIALHRRSSDLLSPANPEDDIWVQLARIVGGTIHGVVNKHSELEWSEGIGVSLDWANERLWLLVEPRTIFSGITAANKAIAADFSRERTVKRYNKQLNELFTFWAKLVAGNGDDLRALGIGDGVDATFRLASETGYTWRSQS
jgi:hypothetical protein